MLVLLAYLYYRNNVCIVDGVGMEPTLREGQVVWVDEVGHISRGDIILVRNPLHKTRVFSTLKRCMALPGDTLQISNRQLYVNGRPQKQNFCQFNCRLMLLNDKEIDLAANRYGLSNLRNGNMQQVLPIMEPVYQTMIRDSLLKSVQILTTSSELHDRCLFPFSSFLRWNKDFYGPLVVPKKGMTIKLSIGNIVYYKSVLVNYEGVKLEYRNGTCYLDGKAAEQYTFKRDYYYYLNDYRDDVSDSRTFGPVPLEFAQARFVKKLGFSRKR